MEVKNICLNCKYFKKADQNWLGWCLRYPPVGGEVDKLGYMFAARFPVVYDNSWCGEYVGLVTDESKRR